MAQVNLKGLVGRLDDTCRRTLEAAAGLCLSRTNYNVEIEHWLVKLLEIPNSDLARICKAFEIDPSWLVARTVIAHEPATSRSMRLPFAVTTPVVG